MSDVEPEADQLMLDADSLVSIQHETNRKLRRQVADLWHALLAIHQHHPPYFENMCCRTVTRPDIMHTVATVATIDIETDEATEEDGS